jgi:hypothetical protein
MLIEDGIEALKPAADDAVETEDAVPITTLEELPVPGIDDSTAVPLEDATTVPMKLDVLGPVPETDRLESEPALEEGVKDGAAELKVDEKSIAEELPDEADADDSNEEVACIPEVLELDCVEAPMGPTAVPEADEAVKLLDCVEVAKDMEIGGGTRL